MTSALRLDPKKLLITVKRLDKRIRERFEESGLSGVCTALVERTASAGTVCEQIRKPNIMLRIGSGTIILTMVLLVLGAAYVAIDEARSTPTPADWRDIPTVGEAIANELLLLAAAIWFFISLERRRKRERVLDALADLRTLAHLVDIHQLTKNPEAIDGSRNTASSPKRALDRFAMGRYLDYCSEMLSMTAKVAALYGEAFNDSSAVDAVTDLETLCIGLQRKIWQKIVILESRPAPPPSARVVLSEEE